MQKVANRLDNLRIPYVFAGDIALCAHGYVMNTVDVDLLVTPEDLTRVHRELEGLGYLPPYTGSRNLRDVDTGVAIEFIVTGAYPGDGKPKPVAFPDPRNCGVEKDGLKFIALNALVELKLASGMTSPRRMKDLTDVMELIDICKLKDDFANELNPYVRDKFLELWRIVQSDSGQPNA